jgi:hypothetical protein
MVVQRASDTQAGRSIACRLSVLSQRRPGACRILSQRNAGSFRVTDCALAAPCVARLKRRPAVTFPRRLRVQGREQTQIKTMPPLMHIPETNVLNHPPQAVKEKASR